MTDDTNKKPPGDKTGESAKVEQSDDDGWGQAAADAGWAPPMPSARAKGGETSGETSGKTSGETSAGAKQTSTGATAASGGDKTAAKVEHPPAAAKRVPSTTEHKPAAAKPTPSTTEHKPATAKPTPSTSERTPSTSERAARNTDAPAGRGKGAAPVHYKPPEPEPPPPRRESLRAAAGIEKKPSRAERAKAKAEAKAAAKAAAKAKRLDARTAKKSRDTGDDDDTGRRRLSPFAVRIAVAIAIASVGVGALIVLGMFNSKQYFLVCHAKTITAERGRRFPPWGHSTLSGDAWVPIVIPPNTECVDTKLDSKKELEVLYADALYAQADKRLLSRDPTQIDEAAKQLTQALLLTRDPERKQTRDAITRLQGDVEYSRARAQATTAAETLRNAATQFEQAAQKIPRHTRDSAAWAAYARQLSGEILLGPTELRKNPPDTPTPPDTRPGPPPTAVPHDAGVPHVAPVDAQPGTALPPEADATPAPPDAGLPTGGVLL